MDPGSSYNTQIEEFKEAKMNVLLLCPGSWQTWLRNRYDMGSQIQFITQND